ncbi:MAG: hypothetical protein AKCLJLPJ_01681 [Fimbriimonadales bacterium]|nr:MAG: hypothetical protein EDM73_11895 [Armatimonadota bacterium]MBV6503600.1 hypothetical protein [Fimbriimonadales bacterium]MCE7900682.1 hypothetical protein [Armatimonadetes bacterium ATM1]MDL1928562.1 hypothetical protein [Fimbriimonadia bacterium ATM]MBC6970044.1 hypothetical protein [Armatimonadota bacterium]
MHEHDSEPHVDQGYEKDDLYRPKSAFIFSFGILAGTALFIVLMIGVNRFVLNRRPTLESTPWTQTKFDPTGQAVVEAAPTENFKKHFEQEQEMLTTYGWVDKEKGVVRIPIQKAMEIAAQRGLPLSKPAAEPQPSTDTPKQEGNG